MTLVMDRKPRTQILEDAGVPEGFLEFSVYEALRALCTAKGYRTAEYTAAAVLSEIGAPRFQRMIEHD